MTAEKGKGRRQTTFRSYKWVYAKSLLSSFFFVTTRLNVTHPEAESGEEHTADLAPLIEPYESHRFLCLVVTSS
jgi:hypothetical protein